MTRYEHRGLESPTSLLTAESKDEALSRAAALRNYCSKMAANYKKALLEISRRLKKLKDNVRHDASARKNSESWVLIYKISTTRDALFDRGRFYLRHKRYAELYDAYLSGEKEKVLEIANQLAAENGGQRFYDFENWEKRFVAIAARR